MVPLARATAVTVTDCIGVMFFITVVDLLYSPPWIKVSGKGLLLPALGGTTVYCTVLYYSVLSCAT